MTASMPPAPARLRNRYNLVQDGDPGGQPMVFLHGYGCDHTMWRFVAPSFERDFRVILYDQVGFGRSDVTAWDAATHSQLTGYADDLLDVVHGLALEDVIVVAHSMAATVATIAANREPDRFARLIMVCPSPRFLDDPADGYVGGFDAVTMAGMMAGLERDFDSWAAGVTPAIMGNADRPELCRELRASFCRTDARVAKAVAKATFLSDHRSDFARLTVPTVVITTTDDVIAPAAVGAWLETTVSGVATRTLRATGHCPHLSAPTETGHAIWRALGAA